jgi:predicted nucleic acid-binding protein
LSLYDTRFFIEFFYSYDKGFLEDSKLMVTNNKNKYVSTIVLHGVYKLVLEKEGRETAKLRCTVIQKEFDIIDVDSQLAISSAELRHEYNVPMADSIIAAT